MTRHGHAHAEAQIRLFADLDEAQAVDLFAGGGGASLGIERALGRSPFLAVNHDEHAIAMHKLNHPRTEHRCESVYDVDPIEACAGRRVDLLWASPDCKHFSRAKGGKPKSKNIRALAWVVVTWARAVRPRLIVVENVDEFQTWGPLDDAGQPIPERAGDTYRLWVRQLEEQGYAVEARSLSACDYGAPTTRRRLFVVARRDGKPIRWPEPTHGPGTPRPHATAADCIDWSIPCPSIFDRDKPLAPNTCRRIAHGIMRYVVNDPAPYLVPGDAAACMVHVGNGERRGQAPRTYDVRRPLGTVVAGGQKHGLVAAFLSKHYGGVVGHRLDRPIGTITATDHHGPVVAHLLKMYGTSTAADVRAPLPTVTATGNHLWLVSAFLAAYYGSEKDGQRMDHPMRTIPTVDRFGLVTVEINGETWALADIGFRMLQPRELARAQGFPESYHLTGTKREQVARIGNSVCPPVAEAVVRAQAVRP